MSHLIVFESPFGVVALTRDALQEALAAAAEILPSSAPAPANPAPDERWLTAEECEAATGVPKSWFAEGARRGTIPCKRAGHYVRFCLSELDAALAQRPKDARIRNDRVITPNRGAKSASDHGVTRLRLAKVAPNVARSVAPERQNDVSSDGECHMTARARPPRNAQAPRPSGSPSLSCLPEGAAPAASWSAA